ncbi:Ectoine dioxygenase [Frankliniella fusca]|uniref:Ectoine dioxygenase n=1 Tax=Frankliniella fusca TaxID=407009 RepID=A0AAE1GVY5_9NEOP|nr:Ectoine dioxygenase [Frankliniella fusca]
MESITDTSYTPRWRYVPVRGVRGLMPGTGGMLSSPLGSSRIPRSSRLRRRGRTGVWASRSTSLHAPVSGSRSSLRLRVGARRRLARSPMDRLDVGDSSFLLLRTPPSDYPLCAAAALALNPDDPTAALHRGRELHRTLVNWGPRPGPSRHRPDDVVAQGLADLLLRPIELWSLDPLESRVLLPAGLCPDPRIAPLALLHHGARARLTRHYRWVMEGTRPRGGRGVALLVRRDLPDFRLRSYTIFHRDVLTAEVLLGGLLFTVVVTHLPSAGAPSQRTAMEALAAAVAAARPSQWLLLLGDFNARLGKDGCTGADDVVGPVLLHDVTNPAGAGLRALAERYRLRVLTTSVRSRGCRVTWVAGGADARCDAPRSQVDHILTDYPPSCAW